MKPKQVYYVEIFHGAAWQRLPEEHASASRAGRIALNAHGQARVVRGPSALVATTALNTARDALLAKGGSQ